MNKTARGFCLLLPALWFGATLGMQGQPSTRQQLELPLALPRPIAAGSPLAKVDPSLLRASGSFTVLVRMSAPPLSVVAGPNARGVDAQLSTDAQRAHLQTLLEDQAGAIRVVEAAGGVVLGQLGRALNGVVVTVDAGMLPHLADLASVSSIRPITDYQRHLDDTVPFVGAQPFRLAGIDGTGIKVAVLDSGVDYTHVNLGGPGTIEAYQAAYGISPTDLANTRRDGLFPTLKVVEGFDFVGEEWPDGPLRFDEDPIDFEGHGTHVADIIAGLNGLAPGARLYAYKVCSAISTACSGVGILFGLEAAVDPDGDGDISDAVDVINLSVGVPYGQIQDDTAAAVQNLVQMGIVVVCSAGNSGDQPYVVGSPGVAPGAIAVAQTHVPGARAFRLGIQRDSAPVEYLTRTASVEWAPLQGEVSGIIEVLAEVDGDETSGAGCDPIAGDGFRGKVALIDRGGCAISQKVDHAAQAGAVAVIIANNTSGDPPTFAFGGGTRMVPTLVITRADANAIKAGVKDGSIMTATFSETDFTSLVGSVVPSSSRGPAPSNQAIKPDLAAPGALVSAMAGSGTGTTAFGGTSGSAPVVTGAAALVLERNPSLAPHEIKALLMNNAETRILQNPVTSPGLPAPITRIGAGEVRVDRALAATSLAYDRATLVPSLSFGYVAVNSAAVITTYRRWLEVRNLGAAPRTYTASSTFRYEDDAESAAVTISFEPAELTVPPGGHGAFRVSLSLDAAKLPNWEDYLDGGPRGGSGEGLRRLEYDGYVEIDSDVGERLSLPWQILPRKAADVRPGSKEIELIPSAGTARLRLSNEHGSRGGITEIFDLLGTSPVDYPTPPPPGASYEWVDLKSFGARSLSVGGADYIQFAVAIHGEPSHANYPAGVAILIDTDSDGLHDYEVYHQEDVGFAASSQNTTVVYDVALEAESIPFFTDTDLHSGVWVFTVPLSLLGMQGFDEPMELLVLGYDNYYTGAITDILADGPYWILYTPSVPRFRVEGPTHGFGVAIPQHRHRMLRVRYLPGGDLWSPSHTGFQLFHRQATPKRWTDEIKVILPPNSTGTTDEQP